MKIYLSHSRNSDYQNEIYKPLRQSELNTLYEIILPHENVETPFSSKELLSQKKVDLVIAEVSQAATGQGIELGWADANEIPIICIHKVNAKLSGSLTVICNTFIEYNDSSDLLRKLEGYLHDRFHKSLDRI
jgi:hypothetical protein